MILHVYQLKLSHFTHIQHKCFTSIGTTIVVVPLPPLKFLEHNTYNIPASTSKFTGEENRHIGMTEVELQLRLDPEGRTIPSEDFCKSSSRSVGKEEVKMDYSSKTVLTSLVEEACSDLLDDLLFDCEITDCALLPRTFWINCDEKPRCALEQMALEVFKHHVKDGVNFDPSTSGAEWWVQIRPSPPAGRYRLLDDGKDGKDEDADDLETTGICFHWDKDEDLRLMMGGNMYIHPHISTVTYMSDSGAPTLALNNTVNPFTGEYLSPSEQSAYLSWPKQGKHLSFDGRFLHAAPSNLMEKGAFEKQMKVSDDISDENLKKKQLRRQRRVTFLVNVWLNYKPFNVEPFPESMMDKLTKISGKHPHLLFSEEEDCSKDCQNTVETVDDASNVTSFNWQMGGCDSKESISMNLPLEPIQNEMKVGGNVQLKWTCKEGAIGGVRLVQSCDTSVDTHTCLDNKRQKVI